MRKNYKSLFYLLLSVCLFGCKQAKIKYLNKHVFQELFSLKITSQLYRGDFVNSYSSRINKNIAGEVANFVKTYPYRFEYIVAHALDTCLSRQIVQDTTTIKKKFKEYLLSDNFYQQFTLLINPIGNSIAPNLVFSKEKYFETASLFSMCDDVSKKDTSVSYHICVGINGFSKLENTNENLALQA